ncbi:MAG: hypothetical protein ACK4RF_09845 [Cyclobacteriaceae bacterium]
MARYIIILFLLSAAAHAQQSPIERWSKKLQDYYALNKPVKLHLLFNQPMYAPGDTAFFRIAFVTAEEMTPIKGFNLIEIDVVDNTGTVVIHQVARIRDGWGANQIVLPEEILPGNYRVVAYDNWMKNFDRSRYFEGELRVAGEFVFSDHLPSDKLVCFPEGGKLVAAVQNKVVVYAPTAHQKGTVADAAGHFVTDFSIDRNGYGLFFLTPDRGMTYTVKVDNKVSTLVTSDDGIALLVTPSTLAKTPHRILIQAPAMSGFRNEPLNLLISGHGTVYYSASFVFNEKGFINLAVPASALAQGICYLTINRNNGETLASRIFFNNRNSLVKATMLSDKKSYGTRSEVKVDVSLTDGDGQPLLARMSVSVYQGDIFPPSGAIKNNTEQYFSWISDLNEAPHPGFEADLKTTDGLLMLDRMLVTKSWPWYTWEKVLDKPASPQFLFRDYQQVSGRLVETSTGKPFADSVSITFFVTGTQDVYEVSSRKDGTFSISFLLPFYNREQIFYRVERAGRRIEDVKIELTDSPNRYSEIPTVVTNKANPYFAYAQKQKMVNTSFSYFSQGTKIAIEGGNNNARVEKELFEPDVEVDLDDYMIFPTMQETLHEIVPYLQYRKIAGREVVRMYLPDKAQTGSENPAFFIDGVLTDDPSYFLKLKPVEVDKIKLVYSAFKLEELGAISRNGVVLVETKIQNNAEKVASATRSFYINGITPMASIPKSLTAWQKSNHRAPQLKSSLVWSPHVRSDDTGKTTLSFKTADDTGRFVIRIEGLTVEGIPFVHEEYLEVNYIKEY